MFHIDKISRWAEKSRHYLNVLHNSSRELTTIDLKPIIVRKYNQNKRCYD